MQTPSEFDLFVSYASFDDGDEHYVWSFVHSLEEALRRKMGRVVTIYLDKDYLQANHDLEGKILPACRSAKLFLAFASPSYHQRPWTAKELKTFLSSAGPASDRLFVVELEPHHDEQLEGIQGRKVMRFYEVDPNEGREPIRLQKYLPLYNTRIEKLAGQIRDELHTIAKSASKTAPTPQNLPASRNGSATGKTVLLAQVTDDLDRDRENVRTCLEQYGYIVLPSTGDYALGPDFQALFQADLEQSELFVQLLSALPGKRISGQQITYARLQADLAATAGIPIMQWRRSDLVMANVEDEEQKQFLSGEFVVASTREEFKRDVLKRLESKPTAPAAAKGGTVVLLNTENIDRSAAEQIARELSSNSYTVALPMVDESASIQAEFNSYLKECDALFLLYGEAPPDWVRRQLFHASKIGLVSKRERPFIGGVCIGPPDEKHSLSMFVPNFKELDCRDAQGRWCATSILQTLAEAGL